MVSALIPERLEYQYYCGLAPLLSILWQRHVPQIDFWSDVCLCLLKTDQYQNPAKKRRLSEYNPNNIPYDGLNHDKMRVAEEDALYVKKYIISMYKVWNASSLWNRNKLRYRVQYEKRV